MKIAVPTRNGMVDSHFGHCEYYTIYSISEKEITKKETLPSPQGCGCKSNIASDLKELGVTIMLAGNMGEGAKNKLGECNITVIRGCNGYVDNTVKDYLNGKISDSGINCSQHNHDKNHVCSNK